MSHEERVSAITALLYQAGAAHGEYEHAVLNDVYDDDWPIWYAVWTVEHGLNDLLPIPAEPAALSERLAALNEQYKRASSGQTWAQFTAEHLAGVPG